MTNLNGSLTPKNLVAIVKKKIGTPKKNKNVTMKARIALKHLVIIIVLIITSGIKLVIEVLFAMYKDESPTEVGTPMESKAILKAIPGGKGVEGCSPTSEEEIKSFALYDKEKAYYELVQRFKRALFFHALYMLKNEEEAKDVTQETFLRAYEENRLFNHDFLIKAWLFRVTTNLCHNILRSSKRKQKAVDVMRRDEEPKTDGSDELLTNEEDRELLLTALEKLPKNDKTILLLRYYNNLSYKEISATLKCKLGTVMSRLGRARSRLSRSMRNEL